jgi:hypothetical protein
MQPYRNFYATFQLGLSVDKTLWPKTVVPFDICKRGPTTEFLVSVEDDVTSVVVLC